MARSLLAGGALCALLALLALAWVSRDRELPWVFGAMSLAFVGAALMIWPARAGVGRSDAGRAGARR